MLQLRAHVDVAMVIPARSKLPSRGSGRGPPVSGGSLAPGRRRYAREAEPRFAAFLADITSTPGSAVVERARVARR